MRPPETGSRANLYLALGAIGVALVLALVWVPLDSGSGLIVKVRRQVTIGDALAPTLAAGMIAIGGLLLLFQRGAEGQGGLSRANLAFLLRFLLLCAAGFAIMRWAGPLAVAGANLVSDETLSYRTLRDTAPWKYIGFFLGGTFLIAGMIVQIEGRLSRRAVVIAVLAVAALIALYDLPFDDLLLPPNGDV
ncbi:hypothetical protein [Marimonas lutisalis]|uniref:hypothetical protein n=1 Tax=Marimonas lutisalis TaxID=2545756 RepID=UPI0010F8064D|nr:hypothetical protein [Marimonas lutisalis]